MVTLSPYFSVPYTGYFGSKTFSRILHFFALSWKFSQRCRNATSFYVFVWVIRENISLWKEFWSTFTKIFHCQNKLVYGIQIFIFYHVGFDIYSLLTLYRSIERATQYEAQRTGQKENSRDKGYKLKGKVNVMKCSTSNQCYCDNGEVWAIDVVKERLAQNYDKPNQLKCFSEQKLTINCLCGRSQH